VNFPDDSMDVFRFFYVRHVPPSFNWVMSLAYLLQIMQGSGVIFLKYP